jgi:riboflavin synthase
MFTGIVAGTVEVVEALIVGGRLDAWIGLGALAKDVQVGASVAIDGVCLTVVEVNSRGVLFQVIEETLKLTTLSRLSAGTLVNAERSYRIGDELGGHEVSGHVVGTGQITRLEVRPGETALEVTVPRQWMKYILAKGFVAVDGASLTVGETSVEGHFWLHLIPETLTRTTLGRRAVGDRVNIELDARTVAIVDTVERVLSARGLA